MKDFCHQIGLDRQREREQSLSFGRSPAQKAVWGARKQAQSWQRLIQGKTEPHDLTLLQHESYERELVESGMSQADAHVMATQKYNYAKEVNDYYAALEKHRKK